ncbi:MAG: phosphate signaling complex protein PhoU [Eubacteriales bacterium]|nr:phosphate signaling complex protein PhoU [Eubacteriales bacterium]MDY3332191.1 phosphate signaling complex protein PhoU [Gallibacter sp.]
MRIRFDEQLEHLNVELVEMGILCEEVIMLTTKIVDEREESFINLVQKIGSKIDHKERNIESFCLKLLLQQQPVARDLRHISAALKMITDMERIGDQAEDIAEIVETWNGYNWDDLDIIHDMAKCTAKMIKNSIESYIDSDIELARSVIQMDDKVDALFNDMKYMLIEKITNNPEQREHSIDLLMMAKYLERIGDHITNIADWVIFAVVGEHEEA